MTDIKFSLITIEGKPLEKLLSVISKGVGTWYRPTAIRKEADAEAYRIRTIKDAKKSLGVPDVEQTATNLLSRIIHKEAVRLSNIETVSYIAAQELQKEEHVSDEEVSQEWIDKFFSLAETISTDSLQVLWGKILAREVKSPGSFSIRALNLLQHLSTEEAFLIQKVCTVHATAPEVQFAYMYQIRSLMTSDENRLLLELGIILTPVLEFEGANQVVVKGINGKDTEILFGKFKVEFPGASSVKVNAVAFSKVAQELFSFIPSDPTLEDFSFFCRCFSIGDRRPAKLYKLVDDHYKLLTFNVKEGNIVFL